MEDTSLNLKDLTWQSLKRWRNERKWWGEEEKDSAERDEGDERRERDKRVLGVCVRNECKSVIIQRFLTLWLDQNVVVECKVTNLSL